NNSGKEVSFSYRPSTHFFLEDARNGRPWKTKLPFPVHCLTSTVSRDLIRGTVFVSAYSYHHGCYDFDDREFRGFGCVEKHDTETFATFTRREGENVLGEEHHQPPVRSVSWYHTGSGEYSGEIHHLFGDEYFDNPELAEFELPDPRLPQDMTPTEYADALRALRGTLLRTEVYSDDDSEQAVFPYTVSYSTVDLLRLQPKGSNEFACFRPYGGETITYHYDRRPADPRISHLLSLEHDAFGQVLAAASVVYPRRSRPTGDEAVPDVVWAQQNVAHVVLTKGENTNTVDEEDDFRWGVNYESRKYELLGHGLNVTTFATREDLLIDFNTAADLGFEEEGNGSLQRRLSGHRRSYFLGNDLSTELPLGTIDSLGMGWRTLVLAYTPTLVGSLFATRVRDQMMIDAGYEHSEGDQNWWIPSGTTVYPADAADHFFMPVGSRDPFGVMTSVDYDAHHLAIISTTDALGLSQTAEMDYRTLAPWRVTDVNGNRSAVRTDARGAVVASAVMGKVDGDGDTLDAPTTTLTYDPLNWMTNGRPNFVRHRQRETYGDPASEWQESFTYFDGGGGAIMHKTRAANGPASQWNEATQRLETVGDASSPRWIGNGRTVVNNKGLPILAYEPYFSTSAGFEDAAALVNIGRSPVNYYDSAGRLVRTDYPDGTLTRSEFDPWRTVAHDANDTVLESEWYARRGAPDPNGPEPTEAEERAAWLAARHAGTPVQGYADVLGRTFFTESDYGNGRKT
ncbi:MAG: toxin TcdB middle/C-terminal domain-containing protein, partial [Bacteroidota bacterium]